QTHSLRFETAIRAAFVESASKDKKQFLPRDAFSRIVSKDRVRRELTNLRPGIIPPEKLEWYIDEVWHTTRSGSRGKPTTRRTIFAILALIEKVDAIVDFVDQNIHDSDLPFVISNGSSPGTRQLNRKGRDGQLTEISIVSSWPTFVLEAFNEYQWRLLAPYFTLSTKAKPQILHYRLDDGIILPFIEDDEISSGDKGGYGEVWKVKIHPAHHNCFQDGASDDDNPPYAVKRLRHSNPVAFKAEVSNLKRFSTKDHLHLIKLLVTFEWRSQYYLLFPFADGNLLDFWKRYPTSEDLPRNYGLARWFSSQCLGLAQGLRMIHTVEFKQDEFLDIHPKEQEKIHGRHGDLKPENILWFRAIGAYLPDHNDHDEGCAMGLLKISDFGLTRFHRTASIFSKVEGGSTPVSPTYRAPEYDIARFVDQSYDIWTLGCVLLEFVAWYLLGWEEVDRFSKERTVDDKKQIKEDVFFNNVDILEGDKPAQTGAQAKRSVANEFQTLYQHEACTDFVIDLLEFIETRLMRMGPEKRANCEEIVQKFTELNDMCKTDRAYCTSRVKTPPTRARTDLSLL
ncbi:kinase-like domain-containing protein, partial [Apodospora peruviana]